ncbi:Nucleoporin NDC1 [Hondaea fermentalgiana]|uniref:Nucleoporin NDC1 n=1 Tax=Hondaea fermentalgiana TaxID=2315210 RepID=A0A2R5G5X2_9STRA|nr:Nucleoporin NDC1 [Hondaea fermentalgiana]|eukprot:GBG26390.1 Nucleoporin NDC1 [Hondaea fermentalgiana]
MTTPEAARRLDATARGGWRELLLFQFMALGVWLVPVVFWMLLCAAALLSGQWKIWVTKGAVFARLLAHASSLALVLLLTVGVRHRFSTVRREIFSRVVNILRGLVQPLVVHVLHGAVGYLSASLLLALESVAARKALSRSAGDQVLVWEASYLSLCGVSSGIVFSMIFFIGDRARIVFPRNEQKRHVRLRKALSIVLVRSLTLAMMASTAATVLGHILYGKSPADMAWAVLARGVLVAWFVAACLDASAELYSVFMTENKRIGMCTRFPVGMREESVLLAQCTTLCDPGSLEEALLCFPLSIASSRSSMLSFRSANKEMGGLLEFAKAYEMTAQQKQQQQERQPQSAARAAAVVDARAALRQWWVDTCETVSLASQTAEEWEQLVTLRRRRLNTVLQAIYTSDAAQLGFPFWHRERLNPAQEVVRARAFFDLASLSEFDEDRRRDIYEDAETCIRVMESCMAVVDALTLTLTVASRYSALEPTLPTSKGGQPLRDVFVLGPAPSETNGLDPKIKRDLAWKAELAARRLRRQPWLSLDWWLFTVQSQFKAHDPIAAQFAFDQETSDRPEATTASSRADTSKSGVGARSSWEQQWERRRAQRSQRWLHAIKSQFCRTPKQQTDALLGDDQVVRAAVVALGNLALHSRSEDQFGHVARLVPATLESLQGCLKVLDLYSASPAFLGEAVAASGMQDNKLTRAQVVELRFAVERSVFAIRKTFHEWLPANT